MSLYTDDPKKNYGSVPEVAVVKNSQEVERVLGKKVRFSKITVGAIVLFASGIVAALFHCYGAGSTATVSNRMDTDLVGLPHCAKCGEICLQGSDCCGSHSCTICQNMQCVSPSLVAGRPSCKDRCPVNSVAFEDHFKQKHIMDKYPPKLQDDPNEPELWKQVRKDGSSATVFLTGTISQKQVTYKSPELTSSKGSVVGFINNVEHKTYKLTLSNTAPKRTWQSGAPDTARFDICGKVDVKGGQTVLKYTIAHGSHNGC